MKLENRGFAQRIGRVAHHLIAADCAGQVLAEVTGAVYLVTDDGDLCWLAQSGVPMHARAIFASFDSSGVRRGMQFSARAGRLHIDNAVTVDCTTATPWVPPTIDPDRVARPEVISARARGLGGQVGRTEMPRRATSVVANIESACARRDSIGVIRLSQELIGLGPGLTPSGDDFVGGLFFTLYYLQDTRADICWWDRRLIGQLLDYASTQTHVISYALLRDHAEGEGAEPLHRLLASILDLESTRGIVESAQQLIRIGNTSGAELLAGALTAMKFLDHRGDLDDNRYQTAN